jgi:hypothetical protein
MKTLIIILGETRAHELTFDNFKKNVFDELNADLCLCIGIKPDYDYENPFYKLAKFKFLYDEPDDYGDAFDYAYNLIDKPKYEFLNNVNALHSKIQYPKQMTNNITYYGDIDTNINNLINLNYNDDEIIINTKNNNNYEWRNQVYGIKNSDSNNLIIQNDIITLKKPLHWRKFLEIKDHYLGGIKDDLNQQPGSGAIQIFYRWFLLKNLIENNLINEYDRFVITRSDYIYKLPYPKIERMNPINIWIPDYEHYDGYTDKHVILSKTNIKSYLNIFNNMVQKSNEYYMKMKNINKNNWNIEQLIKFHLEQNNVINLIKEFPYIMYTCRNKNTSTRWSEGVYAPFLGYYVKCSCEYFKADDYLNKFNNSGLTIDEFYKDIYDT